MMDVDIISSTVTLEIAPPFGKGFAGLLKLQKWAIGGRLGMGRGLGSGKTSGLGLACWLSNIRVYTP
jgi:hypothetical protein